MVSGTIVDFEGFDANADCEALHKAMKGAGTDEAAIINVVAHRSNAQRQELKKVYAQMWGKDLVKHLKDEISHNFEDAVVALFKPTIDFDAWCLHDAMSGAGTTESTLIEIMCSRNNDELKAIKDAYKKLYKKDLAKELQSETSGYFKRLLFSLAQAARNEGDDVDTDAAKADAQALLEAGEKSWGTDESRFNVVLASRSFAQLENIFREYCEISKKDIEKVIKSEMSGDIQDGMLAIVKCAQCKPSFFAERLYKTMKGAGTNDKALIRLMVSRSEVDMVEIKAAFEMKYGQTLDKFIKDDISGDYKRLMLAVCAGNR
jgi:hypothetical protein